MNENWELPKGLLVFDDDKEAAMNIAQAKQQIKDTVEAYLAIDENGEPLLSVEHQRPIFLVGAPGIGKTAIVSQIASELDIGLVSYSMTHHTRQSALGLPFIVERDYGGEKYEVSEYTMSEIIASVFDCIEESGCAKGILFLDEINCVSETLYPSMLQFLQFKTFGRHKVPDGWIVVTAGNPPEYNRSVHEFDVVTLDRLKKIVVEPDFDAWKAYAVEKGVHPAVLTFLEAKKDRFYVMESSLDGKSFVTARGWDDLSDIIGVYEKLGKKVDYDLVCHYVQNEATAGDFAAYYDLFSKYCDDYRIEDILSGVRDEAVVARAKEAAFDERLSLLGLLLDSLGHDFRKVMNRTDVLLAVRDDLRDAKERVVEGGITPQVALNRIVSEKERQLELLVASGSASKSKRNRIRAEREMLVGYARECSVAASSAGDFSAVETLFSRDSDMAGVTASTESRLSAAFSFIEEVFGDAQEMLVFTTELTQRPASARYVAQYGSESYYNHNEKMILSDKQRELRRRIEDLESL